jgi:hypothetical protein
MIRLFCMLLFIPLVSSLAQPNASDSTGWNGWEFLLGDWIGGGGGSGPGQGSGWYSFSYDLQKQVIVRKNHAEYPATKDRPAYVHDDFMIIFREPKKPVQATYFDNEGHVIRYAATLAKAGNGVTFVSDSSVSGPRFRLTYIAAGSDSTKIEFDIALPGKPNEFAPYIRAAAHRKM